MRGYTQATKEYERYLSEPPKSEEEILQEMEAREAYEDWLAEYQFETMRLAQ